MQQTPEVARLQAEVSALRAQLDSRRRRVGALQATRGAIAAVLVAVAAFSCVASVVGLWAANTALTTDRWVAAVAPLPRDAHVASAVAEYATAEVFRVVDLDARLRQSLPEQVGFAVAPLTDQMREYVRRTLVTLVRSDRFQDVWIEANRSAHQRVLAVLEGRSDVVRARGNRVVIDLLPLINQVLRELSARLPTLFGRRLNLPDLSRGEVPAQLRATVEDALGVRLPRNFAQFTVYDAGRLASLQRTLVAFKRGLTALVAGTALLLALAIAISPRRRRSLLQFGVWLVIAAIATTSGLRAVRADLITQVPPGVYREGVAATIAAVTGTLRERGMQIIWFGVLLVAIAYLAGPGRVAVRLRRTASAAGRATGRGVLRGVRVAAASGPAWIAHHLDGLRIGGVAAAAVAALMVSTWSGLLAAAVALAGYEALVTTVAWHSVRYPRSANRSPLRG